VSNANEQTLDIAQTARNGCICLDLQRAARAVARRFDTAFRPLDLTNGQFSLLMSLKHRGPSHMGSVAALLAMDRTTLTAALKPLARRGDIEVIAINDLAPVETNAHLLRYDSVHGRFPGAVTVKGDTIHCGNGAIKVTAIKDPAQLPWRELGIDVALECTGIFTAKEKAAAMEQRDADKKEGAAVKRREEAAATARALSAIDRKSGGEISRIVRHRRHLLFRPRGGVLHI
jgi:hypothetical protein